MSQEAVDAGYQDFADRWNPILDVFDEVGVRFAHEVHPREIAYDYWTTVRTLEAIGHREAFGLNWDPSHFIWQQLNPVDFILEFADRIYHVDCKDVKLNLGNGRNGRLGSHLAWADLRRGWDFVSTGRGDVPWEASFRALNQHRLRRPDLGGVGGRRHGPAPRRPRSARVRASATPSRRPTPRSTPPSAAADTGAGDGMPRAEASRHAACPARRRAAG